MPSCCVSEIKAFVRGGPAGLDRLRKVLPSIFRHYRVVSQSQQAHILAKSGLMPVSNGRAVTFLFDA